MSSLVSEQQTGTNIALDTRGSPDDTRTARRPNRFIAAGQQTGRAQENRQCSRRSLHCAVALVDHAGEKDERVVISAECTNVCNGGVFAIVPMGYGVAIGQRYTFQLAVRERGPEAGSPQIVSQPGEIVRVELLLGEDGYADQLGIGVRLFGPRTGLLPTPMSS